MSMILLTFLHIGMVMGCLAGLLAGMMAEDFRGMSFSTCRPATLQCELSWNLRNHFLPVLTLGRLCRP